MRVIFEEIAGIPTRYYRAGKGLPVLLLHGVGMAADSWCSNFAALGQHFEVLAPDLLDNGFTGAGTYRGGAPQGHMVEHLIALIDRLELEELAVIGSSFGALIALLLYLKQPKRVRRIMLLGSSSALLPPETLAKTYVKSYENGRAALSDPTYESVRKRMGNIVFDVAALPPELMLMQLTTMALPGALASFERRLQGLMDVEAIRPYHIIDRLPEIAVPVLGVWGRQDPRSNYDEVLPIIRRIPGVETVVIDRCGHLPHLEHPGRFHELAIPFLKAGRA
jgi:pimeloyl-ACP methyl ester carboxylesterase